MPVVQTTRERALLGEGGEPVREDKSSSQGGNQGSSAEVADSLELVPEKVGCSRSDGEHHESQTNQAKDKRVPGGKRSHSLTWHRRKGIAFSMMSDGKHLSARPTSLRRASSASSFNGRLRQEGDEVAQEERRDNSVDEPRTTSNKHISEYHGGRVPLSTYHMPKPMPALLAGRNMTKSSGR